MHLILLPFNKEKNNDDNDEINEINRTFKLLTSKGSPDRMRLHFG